MKEIWLRCEKCKGKGKRVDITWSLALLSLGATAIIEANCPPETCRECGGKGFVLAALEK